jgi:predicted transcriptional regulator of viral defense system
MSKSLSIPGQLLRRSTRVVRPRDLAEVYAHPSQEVQRLESKGVLMNLAHGYYAVPPSEWLGDPAWVPQIEAVALGVAAADYEPAQSAVVGISAARVLGFLPRAIGTAILAVPVRRRPLTSNVGRVHFWQRRAERMETQVWRSELGQGRVSTAEQALLDVADRPDRGGVTLASAEEALRNLSSAADWERASALAALQKAESSYRRARWFADAIVPEAPILIPPRHPVSSRGLRPIEPTDRARFGIRDD